jgi:hypothetical protein
MFVIIDLQTVQYSVAKFMIYLWTKFHITSRSVLLVISIKPKAENNFHMAAI